MIERKAFNGCSSLVSITIPNNLLEIEEATFYNCSSLTSITIPDSVASIGDSAFYGCSSLTSITIPDSVLEIEIGRLVFSDCVSLEVVTMPDNVIGVDESTFLYCDSLKKILKPNGTRNTKFNDLLPYEAQYPDMETSSTNYSTINGRDFDTMSGHDFESFCANLLERNGFFDVEVTKGSGDYGVDIIATKSGLKYAIQCKRHETNIGNSAVQEIFAGKSYYDCHQGAVLTNQYFTDSAKNAASKLGILLWDRDELERLQK
jgi:restriction system protein